jgi:hypothetical protein
MRVPTKKDAVTVCRAVKKGSSNGKFNAPTEPTYLKRLDFIVKFRMFD